MVEYTAELLVICSSFQLGLVLSIKAIFLALEPDLIFFSAVIASN